MYQLLAFVLLTVVPPSEAANPMPTCPLPVATSQQDRNQAVARRVFDEIFGQGKFQVADEIYVRDFVNHGIHKNAGLEEDQAAARWEKTMLPDMTVNVDLIVAEGDLVTIVWTARGTNTGHSGWFPATGVRIEERGITVWRIVDGKIHDEWTSFDLLRVIRQIVLQLKWWLTGLLCATIFLFWLVGRLIRKLWRARRGPVTAS